MQAVRRILVAVKDPRARSQPAAVKATQLAHALKARLELFHVIDVPLYVDLPGVASRALSETKAEVRASRLAQLERLVARLGKLPFAASTVAEWDYPNYEAIVRRARRTGADLIVADRHAGRHFAPRLLHITDWELLRHSPVPVLLVKIPRRYDRPVVMAAIDPTHAHAKPAQLDDAILALGNRITAALRGTLHAVHGSVPAQTAILAGPAADYRISSAVSARATGRATATFDRALRSSGITQARRHLIVALPVDAILEVARSIHCSILVMGAMSRSGLKSLLFGNTAELLLDRLSCDLLIVKPARFPSRVPRGARGARVAVAIPL